MNGINGLSRTVLVTVLLVSIVVVVGTGLIAFNDDTWGDTGAILYNLLGLVGVLGILWSAVMLLVSFTSRTSK